MELSYVNELRDEEIFFKTAFKGYHKKSVDEYVEKSKSEIIALETELGEKIKELQTSLSMMVRERDNCQDQLKNLKNQTTTLENKITDLENEKEEWLNSTKQDEENQIISHEPILIKELSENQKLELEAENEYLFKNNKELLEKFEEQNIKITELTQTLTLERATNKTQLLNLQSELYKKTITCKATSENIIDQLKQILNDMDSLKNI